MRTSADIIKLIEENDIKQTVEKPLFCIKQDRGSLHIAGKRRELY